jgi:competence protein ComEC
VVEAGRWWEEAAAALRARTRAALHRHVGSERAPAAAIASAILVGDRAGLDGETQRRLQEAGTYHVIAISGGNIAILAGLLLGAMSWAGIRGRAAALAAIASLSAYAIVASGGPSVLRATTMAVVYLAIRMIDHRTASINVVSLTAAAMLIASPLAIADVGFWLTFGATLALIAGTALVLDARPAAGADATSGGHDRRWAHRVLTPALGILAATLCVEIALSPVSAFMFQRVTIAGLLLNFVALPAMTIVQVAAMAVVACDSAGLMRLASWLGEGVALGARILVESTRLLDVAPWLTWRVPSPSVSVLALYYACLAAGVAAVVRPVPVGIRRAIQGSVFALLLWIVASPGARVRVQGDGQLHVTMFDVGQGDCVLVTFPDGRTLLIDAGGLGRGEFDMGERVVGPALRARGRLQLDYAAATHGDADHAGGMTTILRDFAPHEIWWGVPVAGHAGEQALRDESRRRRIAWRTLQRGDRLEIGGVELRVHHPPLPDWERRRVRNNDSLVIELRYGRVSVLLAGDIEREAEAELLEQIDLLPLVVLKVAHHGSATSSTPLFLEHVRPRVALIGAGRANPFGHPSPSVLERLHQAETDVFRTDLDGQIDVVIDGTRLHARTWTGRETDVRAGGATGAMESAASGGLALLLRNPEHIHLVEREVAQAAAGVSRSALHRVEAPLELVVGAAQRRLGLDAQMAREVRQREERVAQLLFEALSAVDGGGGGAQFRDFFLDLVEDVLRASPVEPDGGGPRAELVGAEQGRQRARNSGENRLLVRRVGLIAFARLQLLPALDHRAGGEGLVRRAEGLALGGEDVRMAANELAGNRPQDIADREVPLLGGNLREEDGLEEHVAQLLAQRTGIAAVERVKQLVGLLEHEGAERLERLLAVPRAAVGAAQRAHHLDESREERAGILGHSERHGTIGP